MANCLLPTYWGQSEVLRSPVFPSKTSRGSRSSDGGWAVQGWAVLDRAAASAESKQMFGSNLRSPALDSCSVGQSRARCGGNISLLPLDRLILTLNFPFHLLIIDCVVSRCPFPLVSAWFWHSPSCCCPLHLLAVCSENSLLLAAFLLFVTIPKFVISIQKYFDILDIQSWLDFTDSQQSGL